MAQLNITPAKKKKEKKLMAKMSSRVSVLIAEKKQVHISFISNFLKNVGGEDSNKQNCLYISAMEKNRENFFLTVLFVFFSCGLCRFRERGGGWIY